MHLLVLATRILIFSVILFFFFKHILSDKIDKSDNELTFLFDNGKSSEIITGEESFLSYFKRIISFSSLKKFSVITNDSKLDNGVLSEINTIQSSSSKGSFLDLMKSTVDLNSDYIIGFSAFQAVNLNELNFIRKDSLKQWRFILNDLSDKVNSFVDTVYLVEDSEIGESVVRVDILTSGKLEAIDNERDVIIKLKSEKRQLGSIVKKINRKVSVEFGLDKYQGLNNNFEISLDGDDVAFDNSFLFNLKGRDERLKIVILGSKSNHYLLKVFGNKNLFDVNSYKPSNINYDELKLADLVIVDGLKKIPSSIEKLDNSLLLIVTENINTDSYERLFGTKLKAESGTSKYELVIDFNHPLFRKKVLSSSKSVSFPFARTNYKLGGLYEKIISTRNGGVFLAKHLSKNSYLINGNLDGKNTNLINQSIFVPLMYQIAFSSKKNADRIYFYPNEAVLVEGRTLGEYPIKLVGNDFEVIPEISKEGRNILVGLPSKIEQNYYDVIQNKDTLTRVAVNSEKRESLMESLSYKELSSFFKDSEHVKVYRTDEISSIDDLISQEKKKHYLEYALILALLFILLETLLHRVSR